MKLTYEAVVQALDDLLGEFERYSDEMAKMGHGHGDLGGEREKAREILLKTRVVSPVPPVPRAATCKTCGHALLPYSPHDTSTWREDDYCSARCKRKDKDKHEW